MKKIFTEIKHGNLNEVLSILKKRPEEINAIVTKGPKKDDGQSLLQVAIKNGQFEIAKKLIELGIDVNFMEESEINFWRAPVVIDAIIAVTHSSAYPIYEEYGYEKGWHYNDDLKFESAFEVLELLIKKGADINKKDSTGTDTILRLRTEINVNLLSSYDTYSKKYGLANLKKFDQQMTRVFNLLIEHGANLDEKWTSSDGHVVEWNPDYSSKYPLDEKKGFLKRLFNK